VALSGTCRLSQVPDSATPRAPRHPVRSGRGRGARFRIEIIVVGARVGDETSAHNVHDPGRDAIDEVAVVRDEHDRALKRGERPPPSNGSPPASILSSVDLPAPFGPTSAMRAPRSTSKSTPAYTTLSPYALWTPLSVATRRPVRGGCGKAKRITRASRSTSMRSMRSSILIRLWTCRALVAW